MRAAIQVGPQRRSWHKDPVPGSSAPAQRLCGIEGNRLGSPIELESLDLVLLWFPSPVKAVGSGGAQTCVNSVQSLGPKLAFPTL